MSYGLIGKFNKTNGRFNYFTFVIERWFRFLVPLLASFISIYLLPLFSNGPIANEGLKWVMPCCKNKTTLLSSLLFISNFNDIFPVESSFLTVKNYLRLIYNAFLTIYKQKNINRYSNIHFIHKSLQE